MRHVLVRVAVEGRPVGRRRAGLRHVERRRLGDPVAVHVPLAGDEHVLLVGLRQRLGGRDDDRAVHPVRDVCEHRLRAAVVHVDARVAGLEAEGERVAGGDVPEGDVRGDPRRVEVDRVGDRAAVRQRHLDGLALAHVDDGAGSAVPVERPGVVLHARRDLDDHVLQRHLHLDHVAGRDRRQRGVGATCAFASSSALAPVLPAKLCSGSATLWSAAVWEAGLCVDASARRAAVAAPRLVPSPRRPPGRRRSRRRRARSPRGRAGLRRACRRTPEALSSGG